MNASATLSDWQRRFRALPGSLRGMLPILYTACCEEDLTPPELADLGQQCLTSLNLPKPGQELVGSLLTHSEPLLARDFVLMRKEIRDLVAGHKELKPGASLQEVAVALSQEADNKLLARFQDTLGLHNESAPVEFFLEPERAAAPPVNKPKTTARLPADLSTWLGSGLTAKQRAQSKKMGEVLSHPRYRHDYNVDLATYRERILGWCFELAPVIAKLPFPKSVGGSEDLGAFLVSMEAVSTFDMSLLIKFGVNIGLYGGSLNLLGSKYHHEKYLPGAISFKVPGCFAMTETGHGSNVRGLETTAHYDREKREFVIHTPHEAARKDYIGNAALHARFATVFAQLEIDGQGYGVHAFVVPIRDENHYVMPGVHIEDDGPKIGLNGVDNGRLKFDHVRVPRENMLDRFAQVSPDGEYTSPIANPSKRFFTMIGTLVTGRVTLAGASSAVSKVAISTALLYASQRRQFGEEGGTEFTILQYQTHQRRLIPRLAATLALSVSVNKLYSMCEKDDDVIRRELESLASGLKAWATWHALDTVQTCRECCGGQGYIANNRFGQMKDDLDVFTTFEGDNTVLMQQVSKALLTDYKHQFSDLRLMGFMRRFTAQAAAALLEWNPWVIRSTDTDHLRDSDFHLRAFKVRESHLLSRLATRLKSRAEKGLKPWEALVQCQDHMVRLAKAHVERVLLENFLGSLEACPAASRDALKLMADVFALSILEREAAWYLENGYFDGGKSKAIRNLLLDMCSQATEISLAFVEAFHLPAVALSAPIARGDFPRPPA